MKPSTSLVQLRVDDWHDGMFDPEVSLRDALGFTLEEYKEWLKDNSKVPDRELPFLHYWFED